MSKMTETANKAILTCPKCGHEQEMEIPSTSCLPFYICEGCGEVIPAMTCCVFCDYADKPCPVGERAI